MENPRWVINLYSKPLTQAHRSVLAKGPNFVVTPRHPPNPKYITAIEAACDSLTLPSKYIYYINRRSKSGSHHLLSKHLTDNMTTLLLADSQEIYFDNLLEEHHILTLFNSGDKIEDLLPKYMEIIPSFNHIIHQIGNNNSRDNKVTILTKMQQPYEGMCSINPKARVFTCLLNYQLSFPCKVI